MPWLSKAFVDLQLGERESASRLQIKHPKGEVQPRISGTKNPSAEVMGGLDGDTATGSPPSRCALVIRTMITGYLQQFAKLGVLQFSEYMEGQDFYCMMGVCAASSGLDDKHIDIKCLKHIKLTVPHVANRTSCAAKYFCAQFWLEILHENINAASWGHTLSWHLRPKPIAATAGLRLSSAKFRVHESINWCNARKQTF